MDGLFGDGGMCSRISRPCRRSGSPAITRFATAKFTVGLRGASFDPTYPDDHAGSDVDFRGSPFIV